jgi:hypothetical protein
MLFIVLFLARRTAPDQFGQRPPAPILGRARPHRHYSTASTQRRLRPARPPRAFAACLQPARTKPPPLHLLPLPLRPSHQRHPALRSLLIQPPSSSRPAQLNPRPRPPLASVSRPPSRRPTSPARLQAAALRLAHPRPPGHASAAADPTRGQAPPASASISIARTAIAHLAAAAPGRNRSQTGRQPGKSLGPEPNRAARRMVRPRIRSNRPPDRISQF